MLPTYINSGTHIYYELNASICFIHQKVQRSSFLSAFLSPNLSLRCFFEQMEASHLWATAIKSMLHEVELKQQQ